MRLGALRLVVAYAVVHQNSMQSGIQQYMMPVTTTAMPTATLVPYLLQHCLQKYKKYVL